MTAEPRDVEEYEYEHHEGARMRRYRRVVLRNAAGEATYVVWYRQGDRVEWEGVPRHMVPPRADMVEVTPAGARQLGLLD